MFESRYNLGFTAGALLYRDSVLLAKLYLETNDWDAVRKQVLEHNLLQIRTLAAQRRIYSETYTRIKLLSEEAISIIAKSNRDDQVQVIWYAICKKYHFIRDFAIDVVGYKISNHDNELSMADFNLFFNNKAIQHDELNNISTQSKNKLTKNLFKMLRDTGILSVDNKLKAMIVSTQVKQTVSRDTDFPLSIFPGIS